MRVMNSSVTVKELSLKRSAPVMPHIATQFTRRLGKTLLLAKQNDFDIWQQRPRLDGVALDHRNMRIGKRFGSGEESYQGHWLSLRITHYVMRDT